MATHEYSEAEDRAFADALIVMYNGAETDAARSVACELIMQSLRSSRSRLRELLCAPRLVDTLLASMQTTQSTHYAEQCTAMLVQFADVNGALVSTPPILTAVCALAYSTPGVYVYVAQFIHAALAHIGDDYPCDAAAAMISAVHHMAVNTHDAVAVHAIYAVAAKVSLRFPIACTTLCSPAVRDAMIATLCAHPGAVDDVSRCVWDMYKTSPVHAHAAWGTPEFCDAIANAELAWWTAQPTAGGCIRRTTNLIDFVLCMTQHDAGAARMWANERTAKVFAYETGSHAKAVQSDVCFLRSVDAILVLLNACPSWAQQVVTHIRPSVWSVPRAGYARLMRFACLLPVCVQARDLRGGTLLTAVVHTTPARAAEYRQLVALFAHCIACATEPRQADVMWSAAQQFVQRASRDWIGGLLSNDTSARKSPLGAVCTLYRDLLRKYDTGSECVFPLTPGVPVPELRAMCMELMRKTFSGVYPDAVQEAGIAIDTIAVYSKDRTASRAGFRGTDFYEAVLAVGRSPGVDAPTLCAIERIFLWCASMTPEAYTVPIPNGVVDFLVTRVRPADEADWGAPLLDLLYQLLQRHPEVSWTHSHALRDWLCAITPRAARSGDLANIMGVFTAIVRATTNAYQWQRWCTPGIVQAVCTIADATVENFSAVKDLMDSIYAHGTGRDFAAIRRMADRAKNSEDMCTVLSLLCWTMPRTEPWAPRVALDLFGRMTADTRLRVIKDLNHVVHTHAPVCVTLDDAIAIGRLDVTALPPTKRANLLGCIAGAVAHPCSAELATAQISALFLGMAAPEPPGIPRATAGKWFTLAVAFGNALCVFLDRQPPPRDFFAYRAMRAVYLRIVERTLTNRVGYGGLEAAVQPFAPVFMRMVGDAADSDRVAGELLEDMPDTVLLSAMVSGALLDAIRARQFAATIRAQEQFAARMAEIHADDDEECAQLLELMDMHLAVRTLRAQERNYVPSRFRCIRCKQTFLRRCVARQQYKLEAPLLCCTGSGYRCSAVLCTQCHAIQIAGNATAQQCMLCTERADYNPEWRELTWMLAIPVPCPRGCGVTASVAQMCTHLRECLSPVATSLIEGQQTRCIPCPHRCGTRCTLSELRRHMRECGRAKRPHPADT